MRRKLVRQGKDTLTVSLPKEWIRQNKLANGDEVSLFEEGTRLVVDAAKKEVHAYARASISIKRDEPFLRRFITNFYRKGVDEIKVNFDADKIPSDIIDEVGLLMGFEIIEQGKGYFIVKNVSEMLNSRFDSMVRRFFFVVEEMIKEAVRAVKSGEDGSWDSLASLEASANKVHFYCQRTINKFGYKGRGSPQFLYLVIEHLEMMADALLEIALAVKHDPCPEAGAYLTALKELFDGTTDLFYDYSRLKVVELRNKDLKFKSLLKCAKKLEGRPFVLASLLGLADIMHQLIYACGDLEVI